MTTQQPCRAWRARLNAWFDGETSELDAVEVRAHLLRCAPCRAAVGRWSALRDELALLDAPPADDAALQRMAVRFEQALAREVRDVARALRVWKWAAALLLAAGIGIAAADRLVLPGQALASHPRDVEEGLRDLLQRPPAVPADEAPLPAADPPAPAARRAR